MAMEHIKSFSGSSVATIKCENIFSSKYDVYWFYSEVESTSQYNEIYMLDSSNARLNDSTDDVHYDIAGYEMKSWDTDSVYNPATTYVGWRALGGYINNVGKGMGMGLWVFNPYNSDRYTMVMSQSGNISGSDSFGSKAIGVYKDTAQHNGIEFTGSGPVATANIVVEAYGMK
tara:strand:+ start:274 stop:792 length:519 start_codon:yes stop_codon:yes gene_type:complete